MANLNALIAQGYQFQPPVNPFVQYGQMQQLEQGQQTNELNRMKMQEFQRGMEETNALRRLDPASATYLQDVTRISPEKGFAFAKSQQEAKTARTEGDIKSTKLVADKLALLPDAYKRADTPEAYLALHQSVHADPVLGPWLKSTGATPEKGLAQIEEAVRTGKFNELRIGSMQSVSQLLDSLKPVVVAPSASVFQGGKFNQAPAAPEKPAAPTNLAKLQTERAALPLGDSRIAQYDALIRKEITPVAGTTVNMPPQEKSFETELGKEQAGDLIKSRAAARDAVAIIDTVKTGRDIMKSGMITGAGAEFLVNLNQGLKTVGIDAGYADASANSQAFAANMANNVGKLIKQFGAGTGLSNADREYAEKMAGSKITLDSKAINRILDINERASRNVITRHNKDVKGIKTNIPLEVELPPEIKAPAMGNAPSSAIDYLRANPSMRGAFDAKYGAGAADLALKGQ